MECWARQAHMKRSTFFKRLIGGIVGAPILAKTIANESKPIVQITDPHPDWDKIVEWSRSGMTDGTGAFMPYTLSCHIENGPLKTILVEEGGKWKEIR
jgi:hypothetical protein